MPRRITPASPARCDKHGTMASRVLSSLRLPVIALASLAAACGSSGGGDPPTEPVASVLGNGSRISNVFGEAT